MSEDFVVSIFIDAPVSKVFDAIKDVRGWWTKDLTGDTSRWGDIFEVRFADMHYSKQQLVEVADVEAITWLVTESHLSFVERHEEWTGTRIRFLLAAEGEGTRLQFIHHGLTDALQCHSACSAAWPGYIDRLRILAER